MHLFPAYTSPRYGQKIQYTKCPDNQPKLRAEENKIIQRIVGKFNFINRTVDSTMITALSGIAVDQAAATEETMQRTKKFLDYVAPQEDLVRTYRVIDMILAGHRDAGYLNKKNAHSRVGDHWFMSEEKNPQTTAPFSTSHM